MTTKNNGNNIELNLSTSQSSTIGETINGLNFIALNAERNGLKQISRLIRATMADIASWVDNYDGSDQFKKYPEYFLDASMFSALEFLAKFALLDDEKIKKDVLEFISKLEEQNKSDHQYN